VDLTVLGGAAACPNPAQGCAGYLVTHEGTRVVLDCGPGILPVLRDLTDMRTLDAIIISHLHADHTLDLVPLRYGLKYGPGATDRRLPVFLPPGGLAFLDRIAGALATDGEPAGDFFESVFALTEYDPASTLTVGTLTIRFHPTRHAIPCWAMRIEDGEHSLVYLADTAPTPDVARFAHGADLVICEATLNDPEFSATVGHLTARQAGEMAAAAEARTLLLTHYWVELGRDRLRAEAMDAFGGPVEVATPYATFKLGSDKAGDGSSTA